MASETDSEAIAWRHTARFKPATTTITTGMPIMDPAADEVGPLVDLLRNDEDCVIGALLGRPSPCFGIRERASQPSPRTSGWN